MRGLITAIRTLTIIPVPGKDAENPTKGLFFFPVVGAFIGLAVAMAAWAVGGVMAWPLGAGVFCVALSSLLTGGIHLDGLADVFDAFGGDSRERKLEIMKDSSIGSYGVIAVVVFLIVKVASVARIAELGHHWWIIVPYVVSRTVQVELMGSLSYARAQGGTNRRLVEESSLKHFFQACVPAIPLCLAAGSILGLVMLLGSCVICVLLVHWMRRMFGGITGDLIGMSSELFETGLLIILAVVCL